MTEDFFLTYLVGKIKIWTIFSQNYPIPEIRNAKDALIYTKFSLYKTWVPLMDESPMEEMRAVANWTEGTPGETEGPQDQ